MTELIERFYMLYVLIGVGYQINKCIIFKDFIKESN